MTAGTVVITGGILATVILLCIIAVLCYCRLQPEVPTGPSPLPQLFPLPAAHLLPAGAFFLQEPEDDDFEAVRNGGGRVAYKSISQEDVELPPATFGGLQALNPNRLSAMREAFSRSRSVSTDV
ncbi:UPF0417 protein FAM163B [Cricetulus griseus]|uniref:UPF0417 protein FAM163B n=1 Tax=Cricetulus griseus TaxID=10029 RepID=G3IG09_CRIGR|nr:UPF0417 protein FAM163B [Cricetulus griseus]